MRRKLVIIKSPETYFYTPIWQLKWLKLRVTGNPEIRHRYSKRLTLNRVSLLERQTILELNSVLILGTCLPLKMKFHYYYVLIYIHLSIIAQIWDIMYWQKHTQANFRRRHFCQILSQILI